jgi:hypothetical protein
MVSCLRAAVWVMLLGLAATVSVYADPVRVQSGVVQYDTGDPAGLLLQGDDFFLTGVFLGLGTAPHSACLPSCGEGTEINLSSVFGGPETGFDLGQVTGATIGGVTYVPPILQDTAFVGTLTFNASTVVVSGGTVEGLRLSSPFTFTAQFAAVADGTSLFSLDLFGNGQATIGLDRLSNGQYMFSSMEYRFDSADPVPEPATLLLVGAGIAGLASRRRSRSRRIAHA